MDIDVSSIVLFIKILEGNPLNMRAPNASSLRNGNVSHLSEAENCSDGEMIGIALRSLG